MSEALQMSLEGSDVIFTRSFRAPRDLVFRAWTEPEHLANWWGVDGATNHNVVVDARKGGSFSLVMRSEAEGWESPMKGVFREVVPPELIVFANHADVMDEQWAAGVEMFGRMVTTVTFEEQDGGTLLTMRTRFDSAEKRDASVAMGAVVGWGQSLDRLERELANVAATATR